MTMCMIVATRSLIKYRYLPYQWYVFLLYGVCRQWVEAMQRFTEAAELIDAEPRMKKTMWGQFWSAHQRFFKYLCIAAKVTCSEFHSQTAPEAYYV